MEQLTRSVTHLQERDQNIQFANPNAESMVNFPTAGGYNVDYQKDWKKARGNYEKMVRNIKQHATTKSSKRDLPRPYV